MYAEMLADGMVPEGPKQKEYLETLRTEAGRLIHLVENVLAYARLERGRADGGREPIPRSVRPVGPAAAGRSRRADGHGTGRRGGRRRAA